VAAIIDRGPILPDELVAMGLADGSRHLDDLLDDLPGELVRQGTYAGVLPEEIGFEPVAQVALVYGTGTVVTGHGSRARGGRPVMAAETVSEAIRQAAEDPSVDAILFRIDSPGGSALAAEQIWRALVAAREHGKPIVASFSDVAASGGYYVATAADAVVCNGGALTGSIGVFALRPVVGGALDKLGIGLESMTRGRHADFLLAGEPLSEGARARLQGMVLSTYQLFLERVAEGRDLPVAEVDVVAQGRVWTGRQAVERGLVDTLGGMRTAVDRIRALLDLEADADVVLVPFPPPRTLSEEVAELLDARIARVLSDRLPLPAAARWMESWWLDLPLDSPILVPPMLVEIR
jgi:protease-4